MPAPPDPLHERIAEKLDLPVELVEQVDRVRHSARPLTRFGADGRKILRELEQP